MATDMGELLMGRPPDCNCRCSVDFTVAEFSIDDGERLQEALYGGIGRRLDAFSNGEILLVYGSFPIVRLNPDDLEEEVWDEPNDENGSHWVAVNSADDFFYRSGDQLRLGSGADGSEVWSETTDAFGDLTFAALGTDCFVSPKPPFGNRKLFKFDADGNQVWENETALNFTDLVEMGVVGNDHIHLLVRHFLPDFTYECRVDRFDLSGDDVDETSLGAATVSAFGTNFPCQPVIDSDGNLIVGFKRDVFKFDSSMNLIWQEEISESSNYKINCVAVDEDGDVYAGQSAEFVASHNSAKIWKLSGDDGEVIWETTFGEKKGATAWYVASLVVNADGRLFATGNIAAT